MINQKRGGLGFAPVDAIRGAAFNRFLYLGFRVLIEFDDFDIAGRIKTKNSRAYLDADIAKNTIAEFDNRNPHTSLSL